MCCIPGILYQARSATARERNCEGEQQRRNAWKRKFKWTAIKGSANLRERNRNRALPTRERKSKKVFLVPSRYFIFSLVFPLFMHSFERGWRWRWCIFEEEWESAKKTGPKKWTWRLHIMWEARVFVVLRDLTTRWWSTTTQIQNCNPSIPLIEKSKSNPFKRFYVLKVLLIKYFIKYVEKVLFFMLKDLHVKI